jgi:hypothetical protein
MRMSTTANGSETPEARLITSSGKVHRLEPLAAWSNHPDTSACWRPRWPGRVAGVAGAVGFAVADVVVGTGLGIAEEEDAPPLPKHDVPTDKSAGQHRKTTNLLSA